MKMKILVQAGDDPVSLTLYRCVFSTQVGDIIRPNLVWLAGDRARTLRTAGTRLQHRGGVFLSILFACSLLCRLSCLSVISCLWALMNGALIRDEDMDDVIGMILPDVRALLREFYKLRHSYDV